MSRGCRDCAPPKRPSASQRRSRTCASTTSPTVACRRSRAACGSGSALADVLLKKAEVAILDEPTSGLDPQSTQELLDLIRQMARRGMTILLSSHLLPWCKSICDRVALFNAGRAGLVGRVADLAAEVLGGSYVIEVDATGVDVAGALNGVDGITAVTPLQGNVHRADCTRDARADIARRIVEAGGALTNISMDRSSLDEVYVRYFEKVAHAA